MDIEEVAARDPDAIVVEPISIVDGPTEEGTARIAKALGFEEGSDGFKEVCVCVCVCVRVCGCVRACAHTSAPRAHRPRPCRPRSR